ncbi:hypothetical protein ADUPG1_011973, partial [Aduncisulcus paluster]
MDTQSLSTQEMSTHSSQHSPSLIGDAYTQTDSTPTVEEQPLVGKRRYRKEKIGGYCDPTFDLTFKMLFGEGPKAEYRLKSLLNAVYYPDGPQIANIKFLSQSVSSLPSEETPSIIYDIHCKKEDGTELFIVEMQKRIHTGFGRRMIYFAAKDLCSRFDTMRKDSKRYEEIPTVRVLAIEMKWIVRFWFGYHSHDGSPELKLLFGSLIMVTFCKIFGCFCFFLSLFALVCTTPAVIPDDNLRSFLCSQLDELSNCQPDIEQLNSLDGKLCDNLTFHMEDLGIANLLLFRNALFSPSGV